MLVDMRQEAPNHHVLKAMARGPFEFALTGSRYMGVARPDSDWDFITQNSRSVRGFLYALGFSGDILASAERYGTVNRDDGTMAVFQFTDGDLKVQVQLALSADVRKRVRDVIDVHLNAEHAKADRQERAWIWSTLYAALAFTHSDPLTF